MKNILGLFVIVVMASSCKVFYPDRLFKTDKDFPIANADTVKVKKEYIIRAGDLLAVGVFSNNGYELVDVLTREENTVSSLSYVVKENGYVLLPMLDSVYLAGYTVGDAERFLEQKYNYYFVNPFIRIEVTNRRVYVFRGRQGAVVVTLDKENMKLPEVLAKAGGIPVGGKANHIRVIRGDTRNPTVFDIDLSTVEGMMHANLGVEANDIIYIDTRVGATDVVLQVTPVLTLISTVLAITATVIALQN